MKDCCLISLGYLGHTCFLISMISYRMISLFRNWVTNSKHSDSPFYLSLQGGRHREGTPGLYLGFSLCGLG